LRIRKLKCAVIKQHAALYKIENIMIMQIRTDKINLIIFLNKIQVSEIESSAC